MPPEIARKLLEQLVGHTTGLSALEAIDLSHRASTQANPQKFINDEKLLTEQVLAAARMVVPGMDEAAIRKAAADALSRHFASVRPSDQRNAS